jgi:phosphate starvation-inducible membrane PsiE
MPGSDKLEEPRIQPAPLGPEKRFNDGLERLASILTSVVASLLMVFVIVAIVGVVLDACRSLFQEHDPMRAALSGLDAAFIVIILLELVHTTLSRGPISTQVQEFLVIGITSAVRNGLETAAGRGKGSARETAIDLAITSGAALLLVISLWLVRQRLESEQNSSRDRPQRGREHDDLASHHDGESRPHESPAT